MLIAHRIRRVLPGVAAVAVLVTVIGISLVVFGVRVDLVMKAAGIPRNAAGLGGFVNGAHALVTPALVMVAAIAPLALIAGGSCCCSAAGAGCRSSARRWECCCCLAASPR